MSYKTLVQYLKAIPVLEAQHDLRLIRVSSIPHYKQEDAKKEIKKIEKQANDFTRDKFGKVLTLDDIAKDLARKMQGG